MSQSRTGLIEVYTGNSDLVNVVPMGLCLRAAGHNFRSYVTCLSPFEWADGAHVASVLLKPNLVIEQAKIEHMSVDNQWRGAEIAEIRRCLDTAKNALLSGKFRIVVLIGIHQILNQGLVSEDEILELMTLKPDHVELVLSGPGASEAFIEKADLVTEMVHYVPEEISYKDRDLSPMAASEIVTGDGKGKTTYCFGKAMLMSCLGVRSLILQFIKSPKPYGEVTALRKVPQLEIKTMGEGFLNVDAPVPKKRHLEAARRAWEKCLREIFSLKYGLIVLDEISIATHYGLIHAGRVREMLFLKPQGLHLLLSGRNAPREVKEGASCVIEMREVKHPFHRGVKARKGIEF